MTKFAVCPSCEGRGASSAYLGAFTSDDLAQMDDEFMDDYISGAFDRKCRECKGNNVVPQCKQDGCSAPRAFMEGYFGDHQGEGCWDHDEDMRDHAESESQHRAEIAFGC